MSGRQVWSAALAAALLVAARPGAAQRAGESGLVDMKSGRFSTNMFANEPARDPDTLAVPAGKVWAALPAVYDALAVPLSVVDTTYRVLGAVRVTVRRPIGGDRLSLLLQCGVGAYGPVAERYTVQLTLVSAVRAIDDGHAVLETRVDGSAAQNGVNSSVRCASTGRLEEKVAQLVRKELGL
jgi:hypothetical protein